MKRVFNSTIALILCLCTIFSGTVIAFAADIATPTGLTVTFVGDSKISLKWDAVDGSNIAYSIERATDPNGKWKEIKDKETKTYYDDTDITGGETYYYRVRAFRTWTLTSWKRIYGDYTSYVKAIVDPGQSKNLVIVTAGATSIKLAWDSSAGAAGYQIYMFDPTINDFKKIATTTTNTYTVRKLSERTTYRFKVRSYHKLNGVKYSSFSNEVSATTTLYDVKDFCLSSSSDTTYTISWAANSNVTGFELVRYEKYNDETGEWKNVKLDNATVTTKTSYTVTGLQRGQYDKYKIRTVLVENGKTLYGEWSEILTAGALPLAPTGLDYAPNTDNGISLTWDHMDGVAGYEVYCKSEDGNFRSIGTTTRNHFNHKNLTEEKYYEYKVRAFVGSESNPHYGAFGQDQIRLKYTPLEIPESVYPEDWDKTGIFGYLYDPKEQCFYTADDTWQRNFGYNTIYDNAASLVVIYIETSRIKFDYDNRNWMVQLWKGQYGWVLYGSEIGIYNKDASMPIEHYNCSNDEDMLQMEMTLYEKVYLTDDKTVYTWKQSLHRPYERQWWHTGFVLGNMIGRYDDDLKMFARLTMRDFAMRDAFVKGLKEAHLDKDNPGQEPFIEIDPKKYNPLKDKLESNNVFYVDKLDVYFYWT